MKHVVRIVGLMKGTRPGNVQLPVETGSHPVEVSFWSKVSEMRGIQLGLSVLHSLRTRKAMKFVVE
jgi:hypothetical protein